MSFARKCLILGSLLFTVACTKATPDFEVLDSSNIPRPTFSGSTLKQISASDDGTTFNINGECDSKIRTILGAAIGTSSTFSTISALTVSGISATCATDGKFSFELKSLNDLGYTVANGESYEIELRGETSGGTSQPSTVRITYSSASGGVRPILITSGGTGSTPVTDGTATGYSASIRVGNKMNNYATATPASGEDSFSKSDGSPTGISAHVGVRINH